MRKRQSFQPSLAGARVEDRVMPSRYGSAVPDIIVDAYVGQFQTQFIKLRTEVAAAARTTLAGGNGSTPTADTRAAFDARVESLVADTRQYLTNILALSPLARYRFTPSIQAMLNGSGSSSLESRLDALATPTAGSGDPLTSFVSQTTASVNSTLHDSLRALAVFVRSDNPLRQNVANNGERPVSAVNQSYVKQLNNLFSTAETQYNAAVSDLLLAGTDASAIAGRRAAFDTRVSTILHDWNTRFTQMLALSPGTTAYLGSTLQNRLVGASGSLLAQLNALKTPTDLNGTTAAVFKNSAQGRFTAALTDIESQLNQFFPTQTLVGLFA